MSNNLIQNQRNRWGFPSVFMLLGFCVNLALASAQETRPLARDLSKDDHFKMGQVISSGMNSAPIGPLRVKTYQLEKVQLTKPFETIAANGKKHSQDTA